MQNKVRSGLLQLYHFESFAFMDGVILALFQLSLALLGMLGCVAADSNPWYGGGYGGYGGYRGYGYGGYGQDFINFFFGSLKLL